jgi:hypothetical protein
MKRVSLLGAVAVLAVSSFLVGCADGDSDDPAPSPQQPLSGSLPPEAVGVIPDQPGATEPVEKSTEPVSGPDTSHHQTLPQFQE